MTLRLFAEYEDAVENYVPKAKGGGLPFPTNLELGVLGLTGESGEAADVVKKLIFHGHDWNQEKFLLELGDVLWYLAYSAKAAGSNLQEVAEKNIAKLLLRYPEGFDPERSRNRA